VSLTPSVRALNLTAGCSLIGFAGKSRLFGSIEKLYFYLSDFRVPVAVAMLENWLLLL